MRTLLLAALVLVGCSDTTGPLEIQATCGDSLRANAIPSPCPSKVKPISALPPSMPPGLIPCPNCMITDSTWQWGPFPPPVPDTI